MPAYRNNRNTEYKCLLLVRIPLSKLSALVVSSRKVCHILVAVQILLIHYIKLLEIQRILAHANVVFRQNFRSSFERCITGIPSRFFAYASPFLITSVEVMPAAPTLK